MARPELPNAKQQAFCREYVKDFNGAAAARRAGYSKTGAAPQASLLLTKPNIQSYIGGILRDRERRSEISVDKIVQGFARIAWPEEYGEKQEGLADGLRAVLLEPDVKDRLSALDKLARHMGMYDDKLRLEGKDGGPVIFKTIYEKGKGDEEG